MFWELKENQVEAGAELLVEIEITTEDQGLDPEIEEAEVETDTTAEDAAGVEIEEGPEAEIVDEEVEVVEDPEAGEGVELDPGTDAGMKEDPKNEMLMMPRMELMNLQLNLNLLKMEIQKMDPLKLLKRRDPDLKAETGEDPNQETDEGQDPNPGKGPRDQDPGSEEDVQEAATGGEVEADPEGEAGPETTRVRSPRETGEVRTEMTGKRSEEIMTKKNRVLRTRKKRNMKQLTWRFQILHRFTH